MSTGGFGKKRWFVFFCMMIVLLSTGCGEKGSGDTKMQEIPITYATEVTATPLVEETVAPTVVPTAAPTAAPTVVPTAAPTAEPTVAPTAVEAIDRQGSYTTRDDVALYLHTYGVLPPNFITKAQARELGWSGGSLEPYAPGYCIGGDYFGNYEGLLPEDKNYHECDIDTLGASGRGAKRIIYSDDGWIYYTADHYESFTVLYEGN